METVHQEEEQGTGLTKWRGPFWWWLPYCLLFIQIC